MISYTDIYKLPLEKDNVIDWVYDANRNFVFQFITEVESAQNLMMDAINGIKPLTNNELSFTHKQGEIIANDTPVILIRGWGNLTGIGAHNLPYEDACNVQDTFAEFIVDLLKKRENPLNQ